MFRNTKHHHQPSKLSGIGPKEDLKRLNITLIEDLPVGKVIHDHIVFPGMIYTVNLTDKLELQESDQVSSFLSPIIETCPLKNIQSIIYLNSKNTTDKYPNVEILFASESPQINWRIYCEIMKFDRRYCRKITRKLKGHSAIIVLPILLRPNSTGKLHLNSTSKPPIYLPNYFSSPEDIKALVDAITHIKAIMSTPSMKKLNPVLLNAKTTKCHNLTFDSEAYWECSIKSTSKTFHHHVSGCKMGEDSVVDPRLKVRGIERLRVADTSVIPFALTAHGNGPAIMIAEKASDMIKEDNLEIEVGITQKPPR